MSTNFNNITNNAKELLKAVHSAPKHDQTQDIVIIAASKTRSREEILAVHKGGIEHFGENYVQEAQSKAPYPAGTTLHMIGHIQSRKAKQVAELFDVAHTIDSTKLAQKLDKACANIGKHMDVFIQVNLSGEPTKHGIDEKGLPELIDCIQNYCRQLNLLGLMILPPPDSGETYFHYVYNISLKLGFTNLSAGMSNDWYNAVQNGATHIRIGTRIFGPRT